MTAPMPDSVVNAWLAPLKAAGADEAAIDAALTRLLAHPRWTGGAHRPPGRLRGTRDGRHHSRRRGRPLAAPALPDGRPMTAADIRRLMRRNLDPTTLADDARNERVALEALRRFVALGGMRLLLRADR